MSHHKSDIIYAKTQGFLFGTTFMAINNMIPSLFDKGFKPRTVIGIWTIYLAAGCTGIWKFISSK